MKTHTLSYSTLIIGILMLVSCHSKTTNKYDKESEERYFTETFEDIGFSIKTPCKLQDVSGQAPGDFLVNYGGVANPNDPKTMAAYQVIVTRFPVGYRDFSKRELAEKVDECLRKASSNLRNVKKVYFGYEEYPAYVGYSSHNGLQLKGIMISKENYVIGLTLMTNDDLETKFNKFTNGFKTLNKSVSFSVKNNSVTTNNGIKTVNQFPKSFVSDRLTLKYPSSWEIVQKDKLVGNSSFLVVQVMQKRINDEDFAPNINVVTSTLKHKESTLTLARICFDQIRESGISCELKTVNECSIGGIKGHFVEYTAKIQGYTLHVYQYIIKQNDKTFTTTVTLDENRLDIQKGLTDKIMKTIVFN